VASADVMAIKKWSISRLESGMAGCCAYPASVLFQKFLVDHLGL